jgi:hypothetical protein
MDNQSNTVVNWLLEQFVTSHVLYEYRSNKSKINKWTAAIIFGSGVYPKRVLFQLPRYIKRRPTIFQFTGSRKTRNFLFVIYFSLDCAVRKVKRERRIFGIE